MQEAERVKKDGKKKAAELEYHRGLFAILRQKRKDLADEAGVPPYVIFPDRTLMEMAAYFPQSQESLLAIAGVGQVKAQKYGDVFLNVLREYCERHEIQEKTKTTVKTLEKSEVGKRTLVVGEAYNSGTTVAALMAEYKVTAGTILEHLTRYLAAGNQLRVGEDLRSLTSVSPDQQAAVFVVFDEVGTAYLKPVFDKLSGSLNYDDLKILRLLYLVSGKS
jgi:ATP-dependent DNA helicase RecQ